MLKHEFSRYDFQTLSAAMISYRHELIDGARADKLVGVQRAEVYREIDRLDDLIKLFERAFTGWLDVEEDN